MLLQFTLFQCLKTFVNVVTLIIVFMWRQRNLWPFRPSRMYGCNLDIYGSNLCYHRTKLQWVKNKTLTLPGGKAPFYSNSIAFQGLKEVFSDENIRIVET